MQPFHRKQTSLGQDSAHLAVANSKPDIILFRVVVVVVAEIEKCRLRKTCNGAGV